MSGNERKEPFMRKPLEAYVRGESAITFLELVLRKQIELASNQHQHEEAERLHRRLRELQEAEQMLAGRPDDARLAILRVYQGVRADGIPVSGCIHRHLSSTPSFESNCGPLHVLSTARDSGAISGAVLMATGDGKPHYHRNTTEAYYVLSGTGTILDDGREITVNTGSHLIIKPWTVHQVRPTPGRILELYVASVPAWREDDEFVADEAATTNQVADGESDDRTVTPRRP